MSDRYCLISTNDGIYFCAGTVQEVNDALHRGDVIRCGWFSSYEGKGFVEDVLFRDEAIRWVRSESDGVVMARLRSLAL